MLSIDARDFTALAMLGGQLFLALGGCLLIIQQRRWAGCFIAAGVACVVCAALIPDVAVRPVVGSTVLIEWQWVAAAVAVLAAMFRQWGAVFVFAAPLAVKVFVLPTLDGWPLVVFVLLVALCLVGALSRLLSAFLGSELAAHVVGTYVVRFIDAIFALPWMIVRAVLGRH